MKLFGPVVFCVLLGRTIEGLMSGHYGQSADPLKILEFLANAKVLAQNLQSELSALMRDRSRAAQTKDVYDHVYLPRTSAISDVLQGLDVLDRDLLRQPLSSELGSAQLAIVIEVLFGIVQSRLPS
jgi:hypothetical protein